MLTLLALFVLVAVPSAHAQKPLTNDGVVQLSKLGLGDEVVIAKIKQAEDVDFRVEVEDLTKLKQAGLSGSVIAAMLDRVNGNGQNNQSAAAAGDKPADSHALPRSKWMDIRLVENDGREIRLVPVLGDFTKSGFVVHFAFLDYPGLHARIRTHNTKPAIAIKAQYDPTGYYYLGKLDSNDDENNRSLKIDHKGGVFSSTARVVPAGRWYAEYDANEISPGMWRIVPKRDLKRGEYGIVVEGGILYEFGVD
jgi:hypothetical protein